MKDLSGLFFDQTIPIPAEFYSSETGKPFEYCIACERDLLNSDADYVVEKAVKQFKDYDASDVVFEYAMCSKCYMEIIESFSEASLQKMSAYFEMHVDFEKRRQQLLNKDSLEIKDWLSHCLVKGTPRNEMSEYQICAQCNGDRLSLFYLPFMIGFEAMDELTRLLSDKTLGEIDDFFGRYCGLPPEFKDMFDDHRIFIL